MQHHLLASYQDAQDRLCVATKGHPVLRMDFGMNGTFTHQDQAQSQFFSGLRQYSMLNFVLEELDESVEGGGRYTHITAISGDVKGHSSSYVIASLEKIKDIMLPFTSLTIWSDGSSSQFKSRFTTEMLRKLALRWKVTIWRNWTAPGHGKGLVDSLSRVVNEMVKSDATSATPKISMHDHPTTLLVKMLNEKRR